ncbi:FAD-binding oxidoreductase [Elizabethkingia sp. JS20170427COW]|uniref:FAD-binding oxidoreductase n=1 Tax=Elizabethkingia sp. JS20170427COW TaxID=2583851 RepID=UPI00111096C0|nr:FAD-binding oxidoreductase [Elizabethkingia sp. JS20170427COW]QCX52528.1 2Fe-2S iron-sulfur cluster binding domain-containing protein [Elizabethkingia sp. JS20170427COW]
MKNKYYQVKILEIEYDTDEAVGIKMEIPEAFKEEFRFKAGQYLNFKFEIDGEEEHRSYSIVDAPSDHHPYFEVLVKHLLGGKVSTFVKEQLRAGDFLEVMAPMGHFTSSYHPSNQITYVGLAAGSGISPVLSNLKEALRIEPNSKALLLYGNQSIAKILKKKEIEKMQSEFGERLQVEYLLSREKHPNPLFDGRLSKDKLAEILQCLSEYNHPESRFFICGPSEMIKSLSSFLKEEKKIPAIQVMYEYYKPPEEENEEEMSEEFKKIPNLESMVTVILDDDEYAFHLNSKKENILDKAMKEKLPVPFSCKNAVCCTCKAQVLEGQVFMEKNYALTEEEVAKGYILTCQSHPITNNVMITYDV